jgi:RNA recognition motif-containing protein
MGKKLYVGNLSFNTTGSDLEQLFGQHGAVTSAQVVADRETGRSRGFGFVEMSSDSEAQSAMEALTVNEARPRENRGGGGGGGGGGGRSGGGRSRY